jgi:hypothetical protein
MGRTCWLQYPPWLSVCNHIHVPVVLLSQPPLVPKWNHLYTKLFLIYGHYSDATQEPCLQLRVFIFLAMPGGFKAIHHLPPFCEPGINLKCVDDSLLNSRETAFYFLTRLITDSCSTQMWTRSFRFHWSCIKNWIFIFLWISSKTGKVLFETFLS